ncbi:hypothetical protein LX36DRAFT_169929 [Colletotrichum falcatum]|nr:hypothetical protein LX36DRAFT_169929 [Colletotrichum falcatum]
MMFVTWCLCTPVRKHCVQHIHGHAIVPIPLPLLRAVKLGLKKKLDIGALLCSGFFVMIAALLCCILSPKNIHGININTIWAIRKTFVGVIAVNAACIRTLLFSSRWLGPSKGSSGTDQKYTVSSDKYGSQPVTTGGGQSVGRSGKPSKRRHNKYNMTELDSNSSDKQIVNPSDRPIGQRRAAMTIKLATRGNHCHDDV